MKKSKASVANKNKNENIQTPSIQQFFKSAPKLLQVCENDKPGVPKKDNDETKAIYVDLLNKKIQEIQSGSETGRRDTELVGASDVVIENAMEPTKDVEKIQHIRCVGASAVENEIVSVNDVETSQCTKCSILESKYKSLKKDYMVLGTSFAELRIKYDNLLETKTYTNTNTSDINDVPSTCGAIFTTGEIESLQSLSLKQNTDSTFILNCLKYSHKDLSVLRNRTLKGTSEAMVVSVDGDVAYMPGKDPLSPHKIKAIRSLFVQRINKCNLKPSAYEHRIKDAYMNKLIASGITNISKTKEKSQ